MTFNFDTTGVERFGHREGATAVVIASGLALVLAACGGHPSEQASSSVASSSGSSGGSGGAAASSSSSSGSGGGAVASSSSSGSSASSSGATSNVCTAASGQLAWTATIPATTSSLDLVDIVAGPTNDVAVADTSGGTTVEQHRWSSAGAVVSVHQDSAGAYAGPLWTSTLFMDAQNNLFYGVLLTGLAGGGNNGTKLTFTKLAPDATVGFTQVTTNALPLTAGAPAVRVFLTGGDSGGGLHSPLVMGTAQYFEPGVYCYASGGSNEGVSAGTVAAILNVGDYMWPAADGNLYVTKSVTESTSFECATTPAVPTAGGMVLASLSGGGSCNWNKVLALPTAAVKASSFRVGADGFLYLAVVYTGTINFGNGALSSTGTSALALARFDNTGTLQWSKSFGGAGASFKMGSLSVNANGAVVLTAGYTGSTVDLGGGPLPTSDDTFLAVFDTTSTAVTFKWAKTVTVGAQGELLAAAGTCGLVLATNSTGVNLGTGPLATASPGLAASIGVAALGL